MGQSQQLEKSKNAEIDVITLQDMYKRFVTECPSGLLFLNEFKKFFGVGPSGEASEYAESMFRAFDKNGDNTIDFLEFVAALNLMFRGDLEHKLRWSFKVYDKDGNGFIDKNELRAIVEIIYHVRKVGRKDPMVSPDEICEMIFAVVDVDGDGQITLEEFLAGAQKDPWILNMLRLDMNPYSWVAEQRRKGSAVSYGKYIRLVQDMYERSMMAVRCAVGQTVELNVEVGLHQGSALRPFLFAMVMDRLIDEFLCYPCPGSDITAQGLGSLRPLPEREQFKTPSN